MKILVCISNVPDTTSKINFVDSNTKFDTQGVQFIINPNDEFGLTRAVWFQQKQQAEVTVLTVGDASCEPPYENAWPLVRTKQFALMLILLMVIL